MSNADSVSVGNTKYLYIIVFMQLYVVMTDYTSALAYRSVATPGVDADPEHEQGVPCGGEWLRFWDYTEQSHYYHNPVTGETRWVPPGQEVEDAVDQKEAQTEVVAPIRAEDSATRAANADAAAATIPEEHLELASAAGSGTSGIEIAYAPATQSSAAGEQHWG